jgi:hypothetical protein
MTWYHLALAGLFGIALQLIQVPSQLNPSWNLEQQPYLGF